MVSTSTSGSEEEPAAPTDGDFNAPSRERLASFFNPDSIALVGASEKSFWTKGISHNLRRFGFTGPVSAVSRSGRDVFGYPGYRSVAQVEGGIDLAYVSVPAPSVAPVLDELGAAGCRAAIVVSSGMAEVGPEGAALQRRMIEAAARHRMTVMGPNSLGFVDIARAKPASGLGAPADLAIGGVGIVTQSGALASELIFAAARRSVGVGFYASTGNEAMVGLADIVDHLVDDPRIRVIAVCAEAIRRPERLAEAARRAHAAAKPIIILKVGAGELSARLAQAHTGSLVGDDRVFEAACRSLAMIRARTMEEMLAIARLLDRPEPWTEVRPAFVSISGGACTLFADAAKAADLPLPALGDETIAELRRILPPYCTIMNPLDITGGAVADPDLFTRAIAIVGRDPAVSQVFSQIDIHETSARSRLFPLHQAVGAGLSACHPPGIHLTTMERDLTADLRAYAEAAGIPCLQAGIDLTVAALGKVHGWTNARRMPLARPAGDTAQVIPARPADTRRLLHLLASRGLPVLPEQLVTIAAEARDVAARIGGAVALKIASPDIAHKSDLGGVCLGIATPDEAAAAFARMMTQVRRSAPGARIEGASISPMRPEGVELLVTIARDPDWGPFLVVGLGGVHVELLDDTAARLAPVRAATVEAMLAELRGAALLKGFRGAPGVDMAKLCATIETISEVALSLGPDLAALEINPLRAWPQGCEILDALALWRDAAAPAEAA